MFSGRVDRVCDAVRLFVRQREEPFLDFGVEIDFPTHAIDYITAR